MPSGASRTPSEEDDNFAAVAYWSENIRPSLGDLPIEGLRFLRDRYITDVLGDPMALPMLREWWRTYGAARLPDPSQNAPSHSAESSAGKDSQETGEQRG